MSDTQPLHERTGYQTGRFMSRDVGQLARKNKLDGCVLISFKEGRVGVNYSGEGLMFEEMEKLSSKILKAIDDGNFDPDPTMSDTTQLEEIACILDELYEPMARAMDGGEKVNMDDLEPMQTCFAKLLEVWFRLRPGSSNVGIIRAAGEASQRRNQG